MKVFGLNEADVAVLKLLVADYRNRGTTDNRPNTAIEQDDHTTDRFILIQTPPGGIPPVSFPLGIPHAGHAECQIYEIGNFEGQIDISYGLDEIYNTYGAAIPGTTWMPAIRSRTGRWLVSPFEVGGGGGSLSVYETDINLLLHTETWAPTSGISFPSWTPTNNGYFDVQLDPITPNTVIVFMRSTLPYAVPWSGTPAQVGVAPYIRYSQFPTLFGLQVGVTGSFGGTIGWQAIPNGRIVSLSVPATGFSISFDYKLPVSPNTIAPISQSDPVLRHNSGQWYWSTPPGGSLSFHEILADEGSWTTYEATFLGKTSISVAEEHMQIDNDPNDPNGIVISCRPKTAYSVLASAGNPESGSLLNNTPPRSEFTDEPNTRKIFVGHENFWDGEITFLCEADASECTFRTTTDAGPIIYLLPNAQEICDGKMLMVGDETGGEAQLSWFFPSIEVTGSDIMIMDFTTNDFDLIKTTIGSAPCEKGKVQISTKGLTGNRNVYKYQCNGTELQQMAGVVVIEHGLIKSWTVL